MKTLVYIITAVPFILAYAKGIDIILHEFKPTKPDIFIYIWMEYVAMVTLIAMLYYAVSRSYFKVCNEILTLLKLK